MREPEPETVRLARSGDLGAFERLVRDYQADVWRFAYHLTRDRAAADDVTQETFLRLLRALPGYRGDAKFSSWLFRIARNCSMDAFRRTARDAALAQRARPPAASTAGAAAIEDRVRLTQAIRALPDALREPFVVIEVQGFSYEEAAVILGVKVGTLKSRMHRARAALMSALEDREAAHEM